MALLRYLLFKSEKRVLFSEQKSELNGNLSEKIIYRDDELFSHNYTSSRIVTLRLASLNVEFHCLSNKLLTK